MCDPLIAKSHFSESFEKAGGCPTPEEWASNKEILQSALIWFWDARTTYPQNVETLATLPREYPSVCVCLPLFPRVPRGRLGFRRKFPRGSPLTRLTPPGPPGEGRKPMRSACHAALGSRGDSWQVYHRLKVECIALHLRLLALTS